jgi:hypothetical protein
MRWIDRKWYTVSSVPRLMTSSNMLKYTFKTKDIIHLSFDGTFRLVLSILTRQTRYQMQTSNKTHISCCSNKNKTSSSR